MSIETSAIMLVVNARKKLRAISSTSWVTRSVTAFTDVLCRLRVMALRSNYIFGKNIKIIKKDLNVNVEQITNGY